MLKKKKESSIKQMEKQLYAKKSSISSSHRKHLSHTQITTASDWVDENPEPAIQEETKERKPMTVFTKLFIAALLFFVISMGAAFLVFTSGQNRVSYTDVALSVLGPNSVPGGEVLSYDVIITNDNDVDIELTDIIIKYPSGSYEAEEESTLLTQEVRSVDVIMRGQTHTERFDTVFFGTEGEVKDILITYEYRVPGSNAILFKERVYQVQLESSPISLEIDAPVESLSGSEVEIDLNIISNANKVINNLSLQIEYPFGFEFKESVPQAREGTQDLFSVGALEVGQSKKVTVRGTLAGQDDETRVFKYRVGLIDRQSGTISNTLQESESVLTIARPPVTLTATVNEAERPLHILEPGAPVAFSLGFINNLATQIQNAEIRARITGSGFSPRSIRTDGFYNSNDQEVLWQKTDIPLLGEFDSGASGQVSAQLTALRLRDITGRIIDPSIMIDYDFVGKTFDFDNNEKDARGSGSLTIKIPTELSLQNRVIHSIGPFDNAGPIALTSGETSEYAVVWKVSNTSSAAENIEVTGVLPPYVEFKDVIQTPGTVFEYNTLTRQISWTIDSLAAGAGHNTRPGIEVVFQIAVTPSIIQERSAIILIENQSMQGFDTFSNTARIYNALPDMRASSLASDPRFVPGADIVSKP